jgi:hypothetical protein
VLHQADTSRVYVHCYLYSKQDRQSAYNVTLRRVRVTIVAVEKQYVTHSECVSVALAIQHVKRMHHVTLSSAASLAVLYFSILSHQVMNFEKKYRSLNVF